MGHLQGRICPMLFLCTISIFAKRFIMPGTEKEHLKMIGEKIRSYCAWGERCTKEVKDKLKILGASTLETEELTDQLIKEGFLDETRYASAFARGKFSGNKWGKIKIRGELARRNIEEDIIRQGLAEIDNEDYLRVLRKLIENKKRELKKKKGSRIKEKTAAYCIQKGYEPSLVWELLSET